MTKKHYDTIVIGAGPGGLACATRLACEKKNVLVVERKAVVGPKACAGGITYNGLLQRVPTELIEKTFTSQHILTRYQSIEVKEKEPMVATIGRRTLGQYMAQQAVETGVEFLLSTFLERVQDGYVTLFVAGEKKRIQLHYTHLVGADGSTSRVRKYLGLPITKTGVGVHYQIPGKRQKMEWHLNSHYFHNGYGWIFPHGDTFSIGGYIPHNHFSGAALKNRVVHWAKELGVDLLSHRCKAGYVNYDYRGYDFGNIFLVGDAAGFASALTGEGIYPALVSGDAVARKIIHSSPALPELERLIKKQHRFKKLTKLTATSNLLSIICAEAGSLALRSGMLSFKNFEMSA